MTPLIRFAPLLALLAVPVMAQDLNEKASRYFESLQRRPAPGPVFDRFVDAWLDTGTLEQLEAWLTARAAAEPSPQSHLILGLFHVRQGAHARAVEDYRAALALDPANAALWHQKALAESRLLEFDQAIGSLEQGLSQKPAEELSLTMRQLQGRLLSRAGRSSEALEVWQKLMTERPDDEALREDVLDLQLAEGLYDAAVENAAALVERAPDAYKKAMRRLQLADVHDRAGRSDAALAEWERCLADSGTDSWLEKELMARFDRVFRRDDNLTGLRAHLEALLQRQPQRQGLLRARIRLLAEMGEKSAAVDAGRALLALSPGDRAVRDEFIALLVDGGRLEEAVAQTAELVKQAPQDRDLLLRLASLKLQAGDKPGCLAAVTEFDRLSGPDEAARLRSAALLDRAGLLTETVERLQSASVEFPGSSGVSSALASALHKAKRREEALAEWKRQAVSASGAGLLEIARALSAHGEDETAWELLSGKVEGGDPMLLTQVCQLAEKLDRVDDALPAARRLVALAQGGAEMENALELASRLIKRSGQVDDVIASIGEGAGVADLCLLAELLEQRGDSQAAREALKRAGAAAPELAEGQMVRLYRLRQEWSLALEAGTRLFNVPGGRKAATAQMLADLAERARDLEAALRWTREWRKLSPGAAPAVLAEARLLRSLGKDDESLKALRLASGQFEENREIREELARACRDAGHIPEALSIYAALYEQAPDTAQKILIVRDWATTAAEASRTPELLEQFEERRRQNRTATGPLLALAEIHAVNGDRDKQQKVLSEAARIRPEDADLALQLAALQEEDGLIPVAMDTLKSALPHDKSGRVRQRLARLHLTSGDEGEGLRLLEENSGGNPPDAAAVESMALALMYSDPSRATALLRSRLESEPDNYRLRYQLALVLEEAGEPLASVQELGRLLEVKSESAAVNSRNAAPLLAAAVENQLQQLEVSVPEDVVMLLRVHEMRCSGRQASWQNSMRASSASAGLVQLPGSLAELRALTVMKLALPEDRPMEAGEEAASILKGAGLSDVPGFLLPLPEYPVLGNGYSGDMTDELERLVSQASTPHSKGLLVLISLLTDRGKVSDAQAKAAWELWSRSHRDFAVAAAIAAITDSPTPEEWEKEAVASLTKMEKPSPLILAGAVRYLGRGGIARWDAGATHEAVLDRLEKWLQSDWITAPALNVTRRQLAEGLVKLAAESGNEALLAGVINAEWPREEKSAPTAASGTISKYSGRTNRMAGEWLAPLVWPPETIPGVSAVFAGHGALNHLSAGDCGKLAGQVQSATLKAFLTDRAAAAGHPLPAMIQLAGTPQADAAALLLAAVSMAEVEKYEEAAAMAKRALERPLPAEARRSLNASILSWAEESMASAGSPLHTAAREAALRLRREAQSYEQKAQLASAMTSLGLNKEAAALTTGGLMGGIYGASRSAVSVATNQAVLRVAKQELENFSSDGEVPLTIKALRRQGRSMLSPAGWLDSSDAQGAVFSGSIEEDTSWPALLKLMQKNKADARVMAALDPGPSGDPRRMAVFGAVHELLGNTSRAEELYRSALAAGLTDHGARVRLTKLLWKTDEPAAGKLFLECPPEAQEAIAESLLPQGKRESLDNVILVARLAAQALEKRESAQTLLHHDWMGQLLALLRDDLPLDADLRSPKINSPQPGQPLQRPARPAASPEALAKAEGLLKTRMEVHQQFCRLLLKVPGVASFAFTSLKEVSLPDTDLAAEAVEACASASRIQTGNATTPSMQMAMLYGVGAMGGVNTGLTGVVVETPAQDFLVRLIIDMAVSRNAPDILRNRLVPALHGVEAHKSAEQIELLAALYFGPPDRVEDTARRLIAAGGASAWSQVIRGLRHRNSTADLSGLMASELSRVRTQPGLLPVMISAAAEYIDWLCSSSRADSARQLAERVVDLLAGAAAQRGAAISGVVNGSMNARLNMVFGVGGMAAGAQSPAAMVPGFLKQLIDSGPGAFVALDIIYNAILPVMPPESRPALLTALDLERAPFTRPEFFTDPAKFTVWLTGSPLLADVSAFRSYGGSSGVFGIVANLLDSMGVEERKPVEEFLRTQPAAFGRDLLMACISDRWGGSAINAAAAYLDKLRTLNGELEAEAVDLLASFASGRNRQQFSPEGVALVKWLEERRSVMLDADTAVRIDWFLNPRSALSQNGLRSSAQAEGAVPLLAAAIKSQSPKAWDIVRRTSVLARGRGPQIMAEVLAGGSDPGSGILPLPPGPSAFRLGILTGTLCTADKRTPAFTESLRLALPRTTRWIADKLPGSTEEKLTALVSALAPHVKEGEACVLLEAFPLPVTDSDTVESRAAMRTAAVAWADGPGASLPRQDIVREIAAAARLEAALESLGATGELTLETNLPPEQTHYLTVMRNEAFPVSARLAVASVLADFAGASLAPPLIAQAGIVLDTALAGRRPVEDWQREAISSLVARGPDCPELNAAARRLLQRSVVPARIDSFSEKAAAKTYLHLAIKAGNSAAIDRAIGSLMESDSGDPDVLAILIQSGDESRIKYLLEKFERLVWTPAACGDLEQYDGRLEKALPSALAGVSGVEAKLKLELALHCLASAPGMKSRLERMTEIAGRMGEFMEEASEEDRAAMLDFFTAEPGAALTLQEYYPKIDAKKLEPESRFSLPGMSESASGGRTRRLWMLFVFAAGSEGDADKLSEALETDRKLVQRDEFSFASEAKYYRALNYACRGIAHGWEHWDEARRDGIKSLLLKLQANQSLILPGSGGEELSTLPPALLEALNAGAQ